MWNSEYNKYIGGWLDLQDPAAREAPPKNHIKVIDADIGRRMGFQRVAFHHITLPPGCRTSLPHAESLEEEFVYVLSGTPDTWIDGFVYPLKAGHAVGFPAGTGTAHTFINNTASSVQMLVLGERTKKDNRCSFPVNPEQQLSSKIWWDTPPLHPLGPHSGLPGPVLAHERGTTEPGCIHFCPTTRTDGKAFHYPGDNETFGTGFRLSDKVGLKALGIWYDILPPHRRDPFPHAHTHEEEIVYVLQGKPKVWMNGYIKELSPGQFAAFPPGTGIAHAIINDTDETVIFLGVGESADFENEKITYPLNAIRRLECERKNWYWHDAPNQNFGPHDGRPHQAFPDHLQLVPCESTTAIADGKAAEESHCQTVLNVLLTATDLKSIIGNTTPTIHIVNNAINQQPESRLSCHFKDFLLVRWQGEDVGVAEIHFNYPDKGTCCLTKLIIRAANSDDGLKHKTLELIENYAKRAYDCPVMIDGSGDRDNIADFFGKARDLGTKEQKPLR